MGETCANCSHYDIDGTELPVCALHRRYMHAEWSCADFERPHAAGGRDARHGKDRERGGPGATET